MRNQRRSFLLLPLVALFAMSCIQIGSFPEPPDGAISPDAAVDISGDGTVDEIDIVDIKMDGEIDGGICCDGDVLDIEDDEGVEVTDVCLSDCEVVLCGGDVCDDGNPCTEDTCVDGECISKRISLDDFEAYDLEVEDCTCETKADCFDFEDGDKCTGELYCDDSASPGVCRLDEDTVPVFDDGKYCNGAETCQPETGETVAGEAPNIDDEIECTIDSCDEESDEIIHEPSDELCDDDDPCTDDTCNPDEGCMHAPNSGAECDDGNKCTTDDACVDGTCVGDTPLECDDENPCTDDSCHPEDGCINAFNDDLSCDDGNQCTTADKCDFGSCMGGPALDCDDDNICTDDSCDQDSGCLSTNNTVDCDDGNACTTADACLDGACGSGLALVCDDEDVCNGLETCDPVAGCQAGEALICDDSNICNGMETCDPSDGCQAGELLVCDDGNICTDDSCDPEGGCTFLPNAVQCDDSDECTTSDTCAAGVCQGGEPIICDDTNDCTDDYCDPQSGCAFTPNEVPCDDSNACTEADTCVAGICEGGGLLDCDDDNFCTDDACDALLGCIQLENALECDDGNACTAADICQNGECQGEVLVCDDGNSCTVDSCDPVTGCAFDPVGSDDVVVDDFERPDNPDVGNDWVTHTGTWTISDGELKMTGGGGSAFATISKDIGYRETFDFRIRFRRGSGEPVFCVNGNGGPYNSDFHFDGGLCAFWNLKNNGTLHLTHGDGAPWVPLTETPMALEPGVDYYVRMTFDGSLFAAKLWKVSESEPAQAHVSVETSNVALENNTEVVLASDHPTEMYFAEVVEILSSDCDDGNPCTTGDQCSAGECVPGLPVPECGDFDHDGLTAGDDPCPYAYDPQDLDLDGDGESDACELLPNGFQWDRKIELTQAGSASSWHRTNEPVEIPLANGILDDSVVGYWKLDGGVASDSSGNGNDGTIAGGPESSEGAFGDDLGAPTFDGQGNNYVNLPAGLLDGLPAVTIMAWVRPNTKHDGTVFYAKRANSGSTIDFSPLSLQADGALDSTLNSAGINYMSLQSNPGVVPVGEWTLVAMTYDGADGKLFVNGELLELDPVSFDNCTGPLDHKSLVRIGGMDDTQAPFDGEIDDVIVHRRALSPDEIATYYASKAPYGTSYAYGSQADFDDVRLVETPSDAEGGVPYVTRSRIIGPRPHSDSACPMNEDDGTWTDREDLCGVVAYWKLDGDGEDVTGSHDGTPTALQAEKGRFGDSDGSFRYKLDNDVVLVDDSPEFDLQAGTVEMWLNPEGCPSGNPVHAFAKNAGGVHNDLMITLQSDCRFKVFQDNDFNLYSEPISTGKGWTHLAFTWNGITEVLYVDGSPQASSSSGIKIHSPGNSIAIGAYKDSDEPVAAAFQGAIDDVILHKVAKSPDYIYNRANHGVPKVRFLANTVVENQGTDEAPAYPMREYSLHWGNADAEIELPFVGSQQQDGDPCYGLLNGCLGYAGWWRFNEGRGDIAIDTSSIRGHGEIPGTGEWTDGLDGLALSGAGSWVSVPHRDSYNLSVFSLEGVFQLDTLGEVVYPLTKSESYNLLAYEGTPRAYAKVNGADKYAYGDPVQPNEWLHLAAQFDGSAIGLVRDYGTIAETEVTGELAASNNDLRLGLNSVGAGGFFSGALDDVRLMNRALEPDEFLHYPLVNWSLGEGGPPIPDLSEDWDHDGLASGDSCPYAYDPEELDLDEDGNPDACEPLEDGLVSTREVNLSQAGAASTWRRTNEPVEIPLANGIIDDSVIGYWKLDGDVADATGNSNTVNSGSVAAIGMDGTESGAMDFSGGNHYARVHDNTKIAGLSKQMTAMGWVYSEQAPYGGLFYNNNSCGTGFALLASGEKGYFKLGGCPGYDLPGKTVLAGGEWHHIAGTYDGSTMFLYVDGKLDATLTASNALVPSSHPVSIGTNDTLDSTWQTGSLDDLAIFNRALSAEEIATYYRSQVPYGTSFASGAQADFDDVRMVETPADGEAGEAYVTRTRIIGPRPHSDTPCPLDQDDGSWADREDFCGVEAYWRLDGNAEDVTAAHDGTATGTEATTGRFGDVDGALQFDGSDKVNTGFAFNPGADDAFTLEAWAQLSSTGAIASFEHQSGGKFRLRCDQSAHPAVELKDGSNPTVVVTASDFNCKDSRWHHYAVVRDVTNDVVILYIDGLEIGRAEDTTNGPVNTANLAMYLGARNSTAGEDYKISGKLDEVILHNVAKSADYIYNRAHPGVPKVRFLANTVVENQGSDEDPSYPLREYSLHWGDGDATAALPFVGSQQQDGDPCYGLLNGCLGYAGWWRFNEGRGSTAVDSSTNRGHGTIPGTSAWTNGLDGVALAGAGSPVTVPYKDSYDPTLLTLEGTFRLDNLTEVVYPLRKSEAYDLLVYEGEPRAYANVGGAHTYTYGDDVEQGAWLQLATQYDGSSVVLLQNTSGVSQEDVSGELATGNQELWLGLNSVGAGSYFSGALDDVRLMNRAISPDEMLHFPLLQWEVGSGDTLIDDFERGDNADVGNGWTPTQGCWKLEDGHAVAYCGATSKWAEIAMSVGWRTKFDFVAKVKASGGALPTIGANAHPNKYGTSTGHMGGFMIAMHPDQHTLTIYKDQVALGSEAFQLVAGKYYYLRLAFDGSTISANVWPSDEEEPESPLVSAVTENVTKTADNVHLVIGADYASSGVYFEEVHEIMN